VGGDERDREKLSWAEIDRRRDGARGPDRDGPGGYKGRQEREQRSRNALSEAEGLFSGDAGGEEGAELAGAVREAHGTQGLAPACRAYVDALGVPSSTELLSIFLDSADREVMVPALERLFALARAGKLEVKGGLKSQLRVLAQEPDDEIAGLSEDLLE
jgi:hypothetical protein